MRKLKFLRRNSRKLNNKPKDAQQVSQRDPVLKCRSLLLQNLLTTVRSVLTHKLVEFNKY